jgi:hypothetical protein
MEDEYIPLSGAVKLQMPFIHISAGQVPTFRMASKIPKIFFVTFMPSSAAGFWKNAYIKKEYKIGLDF